MQANAVPLLAIFEKKMRLEVPLFQRQYVWERERHWEPLWEDIVRKFSEYLQGRKDAPVHFLGAMVLDQKQTPIAHVEKRQIIDGQQRLTTLQIFIAAFRDFCREKSCLELANECDGFILNKGMMSHPDVDKFKVWPTQQDRPQLQDVLIAQSRAELEKRHPLVRKKGTKSYYPRPRMVEAYFFFYDQISEFFLGSDLEPALCAETPLDSRLEEAFQALRNALQVVAIDLEVGDDAQVIFETLNARGEPLLPADLLRNYVFLRAARIGESQEDLYKQYWQKFDEPFWREEVKQGRLLRPRSDLFLQHFLASRQAVDIPIKHLFVEYKYWIEKEKPFSSIKDELAALSRQGDHFRRIIAPSKEDPLFSVVQFLDAFDIRTVYPLLLALMDSEVSDYEWKLISRTLESYLLRRSICNLTTKNYNRIFLGITRNLRTMKMTAESLGKILADQSGPSAEWPSDGSFIEAWSSREAYETFTNPRIVYILKRLNDDYLTTKMESMKIESSLTVEHIMPQNWINNWPLSDGSRGFGSEELLRYPSDDARVMATKKRNSLLHTFGNLTILTQPLNSSVSNASWEIKKPELLRHSLLPINQQLINIDRWNEEAIIRRSNELLQRALNLWPGPSAIFSQKE